MTTYLLITSNKPTELSAFVGPKEPTQAEFNWGFAREHSDWKRSIETAKASRLPVVNATIHKPGTIPYLMMVGSDLIQLQFDTPVELPGWELEKAYQESYGKGTSKERWEETSEEYYEKYSMEAPEFNRQAYRLKRSEPVNKIPEGGALFASAHERMEEMQRCNHEYHGPSVDGFVRCHWCGTPKESPIEAKTQEPKFYRYTDCPGKDCNDGFIGNTLSFCQVCDGSGGVLPKIEVDRKGNPITPESHKTQESQTDEQYNLPAAAVFQIQMIALADDEMVKRPGAAESYRAIARHLLELFKTTRRNP